MLILGKYNNIDSKIIAQSSNINAIIYFQEINVYFRYNYTKMWKMYFLYFGTV